MSNKDLTKTMALEGFFIEDTNRCPKCNSKRISKIDTYQVWIERNLSTDRIIKKHTTLTPFGRVFHSYMCRKCGWQSIIFDE